MSILNLKDPSMRKVLGMRSLIKCTNCHRIYCSDCASGSSGLSCPFCGIACQPSAFVEPTKGLVNGGTDTDKGSVSGKNASPKKNKGFFSWFRKKQN